MAEKVRCPNCHNLLSLDLVQEGDMREVWDLLVKLDSTNGNMGIDLMYEVRNFLSRRDPNCERRAVSVSPPKADAQSA